MNLKFEGYAIVDGFISGDTYFCFLYYEEMSIQGTFLGDVLISE